MFRRAGNGPSENQRSQACRLDRSWDQADIQVCDWPGCHEEGVHRAPKSRKDLRSFYRFCLDHVRLYNASWDYFENMSADEIDAHRRADVTWHRPTWRFGAAGTYDFHDPFGFIQEEQPKSEPHADHSHSATERRMMARLELQPGFSLRELKARYKRLVKKHHPDLHGGDKAAEERLKLINEAYSYLIENRLYS